MTDKAGNAVKYGAAGAATGAAFGPYGAAIGGVGGALYGFLSGGESDEEKAQRAAEQAKLTQDQQAAIAISNYRQTNRDQSHRLLQNRMAPYQEYSNRLAAGWGAGMSTAGLSAAENPVTLRDTGIGAAQGSNYTGWDEVGQEAAGGGNGMTRLVTHHRGIGDYLDGVATTEDHGGQNPSGTSKGGFHYQTQTMGPRGQGDIWNGLILTKNVEGGAGNSAAMTENAQQAQLEAQRNAPRQFSPGADQGPPGVPANGFSFFPRRA